MDISPAPPPITTQSVPPAIPKSGWRQFLAVLLSVFLLLFLADAALSVLDDSLGMFFRFHGFRPLRGLAGFFAMLMGLFVYFLMAFTPAIPKRFFVPASLFSPLIGLLTVPVLIYFYNRQDWIGLAVSIVQLALGVTILAFLKRERSTIEAEAAQMTSTTSQESWFPIVPKDRIKPAAFTWTNFLGFIAANVFLLFPAALIYLFFCGSLAVGHLSHGFVKLSPAGLTAQSRVYKRDDGTTIQLVPMAHVGDAKFYRKITQSFPSNSVVLTEGVSDDQNLLTNKVSYHRMAQTLGLSEQQKEFHPVAGDWVNADIDIHEFNRTTIDLLNLIMLIHAKGLNVETVLQLTQYSPPPDIQNQIWDDLLHKRNRHLLGQLKDHLPNYDYVVIPWGAAHMPELAAEIQKSGFHLASAKDYHVIRFFR